jgi:hypothetical protein
MQPYNHAVGAVDRAELGLLAERRDRWSEHVLAGLCLDHQPHRLLEAGLLLDLVDDPELDVDVGADGGQRVAHGVQLAEAADDGPKVKHRHARVAVAGEKLGLDELAPGCDLVTGARLAHHGRVATAAAVVAVDPAPRGAARQAEQLVDLRHSANLTFKVGHGHGFTPLALTHTSTQPAS